VFSLSFGLKAAVIDELRAVEMEDSNMMTPTLGKAFEDMIFGLREVCC
jgi:hypothetical protein